MPRHRIWYLRRDSHLRPLVRRYAPATSPEDIVANGRKVKVWRLDRPVLDSVLRDIGFISRTKRSRLDELPYKIYVDRGRGKIEEYMEERLALLYPRLLAS